MYNNIIKQYEEKYMQAAIAKDELAAHNIIAECIKAIAPNNKAVHYNGMPITVYKSYEGDIVCGYFTDDYDFATHYGNCSNWSVGEFFIIMNNPYEYDFNGAGSDGDFPGEDGEYRVTTIIMQNADKEAEQNGLEPYDGYILRNVGEYSWSGPTVDDYIVKDPKQVINAKPILYDKDGNIIPLSIRFKHCINENMTSKLLKAINEGIITAIEDLDTDAPEYDAAMDNNKDANKIHQLRLSTFINLKKIQSAINYCKMFGIQYIANDDNIHNTIDKIHLYLLNKHFDYANIFDLNWIDVSNVTDMNNLFFATKFQYDISKWDVSNVKIMRFMFCASRFNQDISSWDVSNVENMAFMFKESKFNLPITYWDVHNVRNMQCMFSMSAFRQNISEWDVYNVENMNGMFAGKDKRHMLKSMRALGDLSIWDTSAVKTCAGMFDFSDMSECRKPECVKRLPNKEELTLADW